jgi:hypothetical protein
LIAIALVGAIVGGRLGASRRPRRGLAVALTCVAWIAVRSVLAHFFPRSDLGLDIIVPLLNVVVVAFLVGGTVCYALGTLTGK